MKQTDAFPGRFLKAADITTHLDLVIREVKMETLNEETKAVVYFHEDERGLVLNRTNFSAIEDFTGERDTDDWTGCKVRLGVVKVDYQGRRVPAIRVIAGKAKGKPAPVVQREPGDEDDVDGTDVSF